MKHKQSLNRPTLIGLNKMFILILFEISCFKSLLQEEKSSKVADFSKLTGLRSVWFTRVFLRALLLSILVFAVSNMAKAKECTPSGSTENCAEDPKTEKICAKFSDEKNTEPASVDNVALQGGGGDDTTSAGSTTAGVGATSTVGEPNGDSPKNCGPALLETETCCEDPTTCLGGQSLATLEQVNNVVTMVGPGAGSMLTGFGKDMSGMCKMIQGLAGSGAALALAAKLKCTAKIASCKGICNNEIKKLCEEYKSAKKPCNSTTFSTKVQEICRADKNKHLCKRQSAKAKDWGTKMGQMANSALSAELCKRQAGLVRDKEACKKAGGTWKDGECIPPEKDQRPDQCEKTGGTWDPKTEKCTPKTPTQAITATETTLGGPPTSGPLGSEAETAPEDTITEENNPDGRGGGGDSNNTAGRNGIDIPGTSENDYFGTGGGNSTSANSGLSASGSGGKGFRGFGRGGRGFKRNKGKKDDEDPNNYNMKGGFSGYAGAGRGGGDDEDFANLKLSKKKLDELEKKKGAMRKTASEGLGGAHENIFERITRRFKALCQKDIDCH